MIPKVIWTFWDTEELPEFIEKCIETWKFHNPDYEIIVMNLNNYNDYTSVDVTKLRHYSKDKPQLTADYIRTCVLKEHGGVWMDASIICIKPIVFKPDTEFFAYYKDNYGLLGIYKYPMIENWFIASSKNNLFMDEWYKEFILETEKYNSMLLYVLLSNVEMKPTYFTGYFAMHIAAQKVLKKLDQENKLPIMTLNNASIDGPMTNYLQIFIGYALCDMSFDELKTPIIKLTQNGRKSIMLDKGVYDCILKKIEHFGPEKYIEDSGTSDLDGVLQKSGKNECNKRLVFLIISIIVLVSILTFLLLKSRL
jgi:hypothetical protein